MIEVRHSIPGRLRLGVPALRHDRRLADAVHRALSGTEGVLRIRINSACGSLLVCWACGDPDARERIAAALETLLGQAVPRPAAALCPNPPPRPQTATVACRACRAAPPTARSGRSPWPMRVLGFVLLTGYLAFALVRSLVLKSPLAGGALSLTGLVALVAALPLLRDAWHETVVEKRSSGDRILNSWEVIAVGMVQDPGPIAERPPAREGLTDPGQSRPRSKPSLNGFSRRSAPTLRPSCMSSESRRVTPEALATSTNMASQKAKLSLSFKRIAPAKVRPSATATGKSSIQSCTMAAASSAGILFLRVTAWKNSASA